MVLFYIAIGLVLGGGVAGVLTYLLAERRGRNATVDQQTKSAIAEGRAADAVARLVAMEAQLRAVESDRAAVAAARASLDAQLAAEREKVALHQCSLEQADAQIRAATAERMTIEAARASLGVQLASLDAQLAAERDKLAAHQQFIEQQEARLRDSFARLSAESLQAGNKQLLDLASARFNELTTTATGTLEQKKIEMQTLLQPVAQTLADYRAELGKMEATRVEAYSSLSSKLAEVAKTQELVGSEARHLSNALRKSQVRGAWGEMTLRRLMEMAGLQERVVFLEQVSMETEDRGRQRPDCVIQLPNDRQVLIDSKAVLDAFMDGANGCDDATSIECFKRHAKQVRAKVDELSRKAYWEAFGQSADYVVLFLPGEAFLYAAVEHDPMLIEYALQNKVIVASPTTLLGLLKVIEFGWEKKNVEENADRVRELGVELYKSVSTLAEHFANIGEGLERSMRAYGDTLGSLERNVFSKARRMAEMGARGPKEIEVKEVPTQVRALGKQWAALPVVLAIEEPAGEAV